MKKEFIKYFTGLKRNYGYCNVENGYKDESGKIRFDPKDYGWAKRPISDQDYIDHLNGKKSIGIQPCDDDGLAIFGAIDIDPKNYTDFKPEKYLKIIEEKELPVIPIKSKSGGLHIYVFTQERIKASDIRQFLDSLLFIFSLPAKTEIYPKQTSLETTEGKRSSGNFINIPYYNSNDRVAVDTSNNELTFETFMKAVELNAQTAKTLNDFGATLIQRALKNESPEFKDGPPCLGIICGGLEKNNTKLDDERDRFLYNYMVFAKKKYSDSWEKKVEDAGRKYLQYDNTWGDKKVLQKIKDWKGNTAGYLCHEEPIQSHCFKPTCLRRKFGVSKQSNLEWPEIISITKIDYRPKPKFDLSVKLPTGKIKIVRAESTKQAMLQEELRVLIAGATAILPPILTKKEFQGMMGMVWPQMNTETPDPDSQPAGILFRLTKDFLNNTKANTYNAFKTGSVLIENEKAYFLFNKYYEDLKTREWKIGEAETRTMICDIFKAINVQKRIFKSNIVRCIELDMKPFEQDEPPKEILEFEDKNDIV
jgi:hypothetical protein